MERETQVAQSQNAVCFVVCSASFAVARRDQAAALAAAGRCYGLRVWLRGRFVAES